MFPFLVDTKALQPIAYSDLVRIGRPNDGGYVVPLKAGIIAAKYLVSFGISTDWSFEHDFYKRNPQVKIFAYDHTIGNKEILKSTLKRCIHLLSNLIMLKFQNIKNDFAGLSILISYHSFFKKHIQHFRNRIWYNNARNSITPAEIFSNHFEPLSVFLKIDIEGSEYRILPWIIEHPDLFRVIAIEFHHIDICAELFNKYIAQLKESFYIVHLHGNNYDDVSASHFPITVEITFINKQLVTGTVSDSQAQYPIPNLDQASCALWPDCDIKF